MFSNRVLEGVAPATAAESAKAKCMAKFFNLPDLPMEALPNGMKTATKVYIRDAYGFPPGPCEDGTCRTPDMDRWLEAWRTCVGGKTRFTRIEHLAFLITHENMRKAIYDEGTLAREERDLWDGNSPQAYIIFKANFLDKRRSTWSTPEPAHEQFCDRIVNAYLTTVKTQMAICSKTEIEDAAVVVKILAARVLDDCMRDMLRWKVVDSDGKDIKSPPALDPYVEAVRIQEMNPRFKRDRGLCVKELQALPDFIDGLDIHARIFYLERLRESMSEDEQVFLSVSDMDKWLDARPNFTSAWPSLKTDPTIVEKTKESKYLEHAIMYFDHFITGWGRRKAERRKTKEDKIRQDSAVVSTEHVEYVSKFNSSDCNTEDGSPDGKGKGKVSEAMAKSLKDSNIVGASEQNAFKSSNARNAANSSNAQNASDTSSQWQDDANSSNSGNTQAGPQNPNNHDGQQDVAHPRPKLITRLKERWTRSKASKSSNAQDAANDGQQDVAQPRPKLMTGLKDKLTQLTNKRTPRIPM